MKIKILKEIKDVKFFCVTKHQPIKKQKQICVTVYIHSLASNAITKLF